MRRNIESKNVWQQILGRKYFGSKFFCMNFFLGGGGKMGNNSFLKQIFLGGNLGTKFWREEKFGEQILLDEN